MPIQVFMSLRRTIKYLSYFFQNIVTWCDYHRLYFIKYSFYHSSKIVPKVLHWKVQKPFTPRNSVNALERLSQSSTMRYTNMYNLYRLIRLKMNQLISINSLSFSNIL